MTKRVKWVALRKEKRPGWTEFIFRTWTRQHVKDVCEWCDDQCKQAFSYHVYQYSVHGTDWGYCVFLLENPDDAFAFKMRWV